MVIKTNAKISFTKCTVWDTRFSFISAAQDRDGRKKLKVEKIGQRFLINLHAIYSKNFQILIGYLHVISSFGFAKNDFTFESRTKFRFA